MSLCGLLLRRLALVVLLATVPAARAGELGYNQHIREILADNCFACHGADSAARKADLRLDQRDAALAAGAWTPGDVDASEAIRRMVTDNLDERMPPPDSGRELKPGQLELLKQWVAEGAEYQPHWSFIAPVRPPVPAVKQAAWVVNPIDAFVVAKLEELGLEPAPEADRRTLARRVCLDITGLPPAPALVESFVNDPAPDAYERYIDQVLAMPQWGEHRARYWLDVARYADTHGIHFDNFREIWSYRDWVIGAFNRNLPYDQFTIEQIAGDLLPNRTLDQVIASGFNRCNITTNEGGVIPEEYLVLYTRDRTETVSQVWLGLTANCAVCHDHKFDPLPQREFYEMAAFFNNTTQGAMDGNIKDTPPILPVPLAADRQRYDELVGLLATTRTAIEQTRTTARGEFDGWIAAAPAENLGLAPPADGLVLYAPLNETSGPNVQLTVHGQSRTVALAQEPPRQPGHVASHALQVSPASIVEVPDAGDFDTAQAFTYGAWVRLTKDNLSVTGAVLARMDTKHDFRGWDLWIEGGRVGAHLVHKWDSDALKVVTGAPIEAERWTHLMITYDGSAKAAGVKVYVDGQQRDVNVATDKLKGTIRTEVPLKIGVRYVDERLDGMLVEDARVYGRTLSPSEVAQVATATRVNYLAGRAADQRTPAEADELYAWWLGARHEPYRDLTGKLAAFEAEETAIRARGTVAHVMQERADEAMAYVLYRGEYEQRRDAVKPKTPSSLPAMPDDLPRNRLGFAQWLVRPEHPLMARVAVNRFWQEVFGTGLVRSSGDFGTRGDLPTNQELLDWLAVDFREHGWDVKRLFKLMLTSNTYRQAALVTPAKLEKDPDNRLLSRGPRFRMDAEMVRDYALAASGLLVGKIGGPSVRPYQPEGVWEAVAMIGSNTRDYQADRGDSVYRRSMYTIWKRSAPPASMDIFNAPSRETCTMRRERTNTPLQALVTLNDPQFVEAARQLASDALRSPAVTPEQRVNLIAERLLARPLRDDEQAIVNQSLAQLSAYYLAQPEAAAELLKVGHAPVDAALDPTLLAAWTMLTNELMNLDEVLCK
ncbi:MAG: DUF1553 domain-containing protein [Pirellulales bacterium]|nr:DUF1553 domain-containing protein [Pirellulales bacterium]